MYTDFKMASGGLITQRMENTLSVQDHLKVHGTGITPRPDSRAADNGSASSVDVTSASSSRPSSASLEMAPGDAFNVLQSVITMNKALEGQIDALRLRLDVEAKHHTTENERIVKEKTREIEKKEDEIGSLKDSLINRDERIGVLVKCSGEKDKIIKEKSGELNELKKLVKQTEEYAGKLFKQVSRLRDDKRHLESDTLYKEQNNEIHKLREELKELKDKCATMETELERAKNIITQQNMKLAQFEGEKNEMVRNFKEELDKASRAMRQEVERMREVMNQNYEEMRNLREQNREMHSDVKDIKDLIMKGKTPREDVEEEATPAKPSTNNINMSTYILAPSKTPNPPKRGQSPNPPRRTLDHLNQNVSRPQASPSPLIRSNSRAAMASRTSHIRASQGGVGRSSGSVASSNASQAGLPPIRYGLKETTRWQSAAIPERASNIRLGAKSAKRGSAVTRK
ncbi:ELKS/Rab6-interacting/CAST family member 1-like isoform X1 [Haliotis rufescens]|uniref:ELKS/Rab6-interacting/CAST family member 1-like isoform X1 n=2 Tax=Haliotis rufescens TaxID=6454 RepID=UPI00201F42D2|nr:ELKS/Rab6-interacting/CAST family member 1-like isoform X1 [Haliotis rufescens]